MEPTTQPGADVLARMVAQMPGAVALLVGPDHVYAAASQSYRRVAGKPVMGRSYRDAFPELEGQGFFELMDEVYATGEPWSAAGVTAAWDADGDGVPETHFIDVTFAPVRDAAGAVDAVTVTVEIVDERVRTERDLAVERARLGAIFQQAPAFLAVLRGPSHVFTLVNDAYLRLVGHRDPVGKTVVEALPEVRGQGFVQLLDGVLESGEPFVGREMPIALERTGGAPLEERFVDLVYMPLTNADGEREGIIAHGTDVTDAVVARRQIERLLVESERARAEAESARADADEANRAKSEFLANMSHELRTPINAIVGYVDLMELGIGGSLTEVQAGHLGRVKASGRHLLTLVDEVLDLAKVESGQMEVGRQTVPVTETVRPALSLVAPQAGARGIALRDEVGDRTDLAYCGDPDRVRQILVNLLSNAVKFTEPGGHVTVSCAVPERPEPGLHTRGPGPWLRIDVADSGAGIPPEKLAAVFEPFVQIDSGLTRRTGGTGLGLTISRKLARAMGGDLTVRSAPGEGSCFSLSLPVPTGQPGEPAERRSWPRAAHEIPHLAATGYALARCADGIVRRMGDRLREEPAVPDARGLDRAQLEDHASTFLVDIGLSLVTLDEGGGEPELMRDGTEIQRTISLLHGAQRARLGWPEEAIRREFAILGEIIEEVVPRDLAPDHPEGVERALGVVRRFLAQAEAVSLKGWSEAGRGDRA